MTRMNEALRIMELELDLLELALIRNPLAAVLAMAADASSSGSPEPETESEDSEAITIAIPH